MDIPIIAAAKVDLAFRMMSSLAKTATLHLKEDATFDFGAASASSSDTPMSIKLIVISTKTGKEITKKQIIVEKIEGLDAFDYITFDGFNWTVSDVVLEGVATQILEVQHG